MFPFQPQYLLLADLARGQSWFHSDEQCDTRIIAHGHPEFLIVRLVLLCVAQKDGRLVDAERAVDLVSESKQYIEAIVVN